MGAHTALTAPATAGWEALGTSAVLVVSDECELECAEAIVRRELDAVDLACSRFREDSDLARVNARAGLPVKVDPLLIEAVDVALRAARLTDGAVDPTIGVALEIAGYDRDWSLLEPVGPETAMSSPRPPVRELKARPRIRAVVRAGWQAMELDRARSTIRIPIGVKLDLGATAKAWAADRAAHAVHDATGCGALVSLGGDISTAGSGPPAGWHIHVTDDHRDGPDAPGQRVVIHGGGLATSSTVARRWRHDGREMHHIIDPITGRPVTSPWRTASVAAASCVDANIASTAALLGGEDSPRRLAEAGLPARLVRHDGTVTAVGSWPAEGRSGAVAHTPTSPGKLAG